MNLDAGRIDGVTMALTELMNSMLKECEQFSKERFKKCVDKKIKNIQIATQKEMDKIINNYFKINNIK